MRLIFVKSLSEKIPQIRGQVQISKNILHNLTIHRFFFLLFLGLRSPFFFDFLGCFLNVMENVSKTQTGDRQTFVLVLFLNHLFLQILGEVLRDLRPYCFYFLLLFSSHIEHKYQLYDFGNA